MISHRETMENWSDSEDRRDQRAAEIRAEQWNRELKAAKIENNKKTIERLGLVVAQLLSECCKRENTYDRVSLIAATPLDMGNVFHYLNFTATQELVNAVNAYNEELNRQQLEDK